ncbi:MAG: apolipoprotein N-acyltransferase [Phycisphaerales bacterium]|nr:MAG: apolipoprotein N-acyltransferase [Phycisphaerales bacterium]
MPGQDQNPKTPEQSLASDSISLSRRRVFFRAAAWSCLHGLLMWLAMPTPNIWWLALLAPFAMFRIALLDGPIRWNALGTIAGMMPFWLVTEWWIFDVTAIGFVPLCLVQSAWAGVFVAAAQSFSRSRFAWASRLPASVTLPLLWVGVEFLRGEVFMKGYPWAFVAHPLIESEILSSAGAFVGVYGVSLLACVPAAALVDLHSISPRTRLAGIALVVIVAGLFAAAFLGRPALEKAPTLRVSLIQTNVPQSNKLEWGRDSSSEIEEFRHLADMTQDASIGLEERDRPDLIVWPETMMPGPTLTPSAVDEYEKKEIRSRIPGRDGQPDQWIPIREFTDTLLQLQSRVGVPMLVGDEHLDGLNVTVHEDGSIEQSFRGRYNSVFFVEKGALSSLRYDKMKPTPFGETVPYLEQLPKVRSWLESVAASGMSLDLRSGTEPTVFPIMARDGTTVRCVTPICFEVTVASVCRTLCYNSDGTRRADLIVTLTNDGWFGPSLAAKVQHLQIARWRSVELGIGMVRSANTGISCVIDARGRVTDAERWSKSPIRTPFADQAGFVNGQTTPPTRPTLYGQIGDLVGWIAFAGLVLGLGVGFVGRRKRL